MEAYKECLVKREFTPHDSVVEMLLLAAGILCAAVAVFVNSLAFIGSAVFVILWYMHVYTKHVEFEYTLVESSLRVDIIYNQKKRKALGEYSLKKVQAAADSKDDRLGRLRKDVGKLLDYSSQSMSGRTICLFMTDEAGKKMELRLSPDEVMYKLMWKQIPTIAKHLDLV